MHDLLQQVWIIQLSSIWCVIYLFISCKAIKLLLDYFNLVRLGFFSIFFVFSLIFVLLVQVIAVTAKAWPFWGVSAECTRFTMKFLSSLLHNLSYAISYQLSALSSNLGISIVCIFKKHFLVLLRYNCYTTLYKFKPYNIII